MQERQVTHVRECTCRRAGESGADGRGDGAVDAGQAPVREHQSALPDRWGHSHQVQVADRLRPADHQQAAGGERLGHGSGDVLAEHGVGGQPGPR
jgi:hypothetical protein